MDNIVYPLIELSEYLKLLCSENQNDSKCQQVLCDFFIIIL